MNGDVELQSLAAIVPNATRHSEAGSTYYHLPSLTFMVCGQTVTREALLGVTLHGGYPTRLLLSSRVTRPGNWFAQQILARNWEWLSVTGIAADRPPAEILAEHLHMYKDTSR